MGNEIIFSIIMASYNSERTIKMSLESIREQKFPQERIEILVVDGGSTDNTVKVAQQFDAVVLNNPKKLPEPAKILGVKAAKGKYVTIMDSDEVLASNTILEQRYQLLEKHPDVICYLGGITTPKESQFCCYYINAIGDPFTNFVYRTFKGGMKELMRRHKMYEGLEGCIAEFGEQDIKPIGDGVTTFCRQYILEHYENILNTATTASVFEALLCDTGKVGYIEGDDNWHYSRASFSTYLKKLKFRVVNNVHDVNGSGYAYKAKENKRLNRRKYLYPLYCATIILPIFDGIRMSINYKHPVFLLHCFFSWYVLVNIVWQMLCKLLGKKKSVETYG